MGGVHVRVILTLALISGVGSAAPRVGTPFYLAPGSRDLSIAGNERGYVLAWASGADVEAERLAPDATLTTRPEWLGAPVAPANPISGITYTSYGLEAPFVVANDAQFMVRAIVDYKYYVPPSLNPFTGACGISTATYGGSSDEPAYRIIAGSLPDVYAGDIGVAGVGFALALMRFRAGGSGSLSLMVGDEKPRVVPFDAPDSSPIFPPIPVAVVSDGATSWIALRTSDQNRVTEFARVTSAGTEFVPIPDQSTMTEALRLVRQGSTLLVVWSVGSSVSARRISIDGEVIDEAAITVAKSGEKLLDVERGASTYAILTKAGGTLRLRRLSFDGTFLDENGVDVDGQIAGDVAPAGDDVWLLASEESVDGQLTIRGRFIGEGTLPDTPNNVPFPPEPEPTPDGGDVSSGGSAAASPSSGGTTSGTGGTSRSEPSPSDAGAAPHDAQRSDSSCAIRPAANGRAPSPWILTALAAALASWRRKRPVHAATVSPRSSQVATK